MPDQYVLRRIIEITEGIYARYGKEIPNVTVAVAVAEDEQGCCHKLISSNEGNYVRPDVRQLAPPRFDEILIDGLPNAHAEQNIISFLISNDWKLKSIGASRPICANCQIAIGWYGVRPITCLKTAPSQP